MKKFSFIKSGAIVVALVMLVSLCLTACGNKQTAQGDIGTGEMPEKLKVFAPLSGGAAKAGAEDRGDLLMYQTVAEKTGCEIEWISPNAAAAIEQFNLLVASGDLPDIITTLWSTASGGIERWVDDGVIVRMSDYAKFMPNLSKIIDERPDIAAQFVYEDGSFYYAPYIRYDNELLSYCGPTIRQDWLDKLGLKMPTNTDELYNVLKAFKTQDPNGNGKADEIPFTGQAGDVWSYGVGNIVQAFDAYYSYYIKDGKVTHGMIEPEMKEALAYLSKLYNEGLLDPDYLTHTQDTFNARVTNDRSGFWFGLQPTSFYKTMNDGTKSLVGVPYFGKKVFHTNYMNNFASNSVAITTACKNPSGAARWIDFFYGEEGIKAGNFGVEGKTFDVVDGKNVLKNDFFFNNPEGKESSVMVAANLEVTNTNFAGVQLWEGYSQTLAPWGQEAIKVWADSSDLSNALPNVLLTTEEKDIVASKETEIATYTSNLFNSIIIGNKPLSELDKAEAEMNKLGLQEVLEAKNAAYKRYKAKQ